MKEYMRLKKNENDICEIVITYFGRSRTGESVSTCLTAHNVTNSDIDMLENTLEHLCIKYHGKGC